jgi:hypothetical protein
MHPVIFFLFVYGIALFLALFVCRTVYYSLHGDTAVVQPQGEASGDVAVVAYR